MGSRYNRASVAILILIFSSLVALNYNSEISYFKNRIFDAVGSAKNGSDLYFLIRNPIDRLDVVDIKIDEADLAFLNQSVNYSTIKKKWLKVKATMEGVELDVKVKARRFESENLPDGYFSFDLKFYDAHPRINHVRRIKVLSGYDFSTEMASINAVAKSKNLITSSSIPYLVAFNGVPRGHFYLNEKVEKEMLERDYGITNFTIIEDSDPVVTSDGLNQQTRLLQDSSWSNLIQIKTKWPYLSEGLMQYRNLWRALESDEPASVLKSFDGLYLNKFLATCNLADSLGFNPKRKLNLIYDFSRGKFYPIFQCRVSECDTLEKSYSINHWLIKQVSNHAKGTTLALSNNLLNLKDSIGKVNANDRRAGRIFKHSRKQNAEVACVNPVASVADNRVIGSSESSTNKEAIRKPQLNGIRHSMVDNVITIQPGSYRISSDIIFDENVDLILTPGVTLAMDSGVNVLVRGNLEALGSKEHPVIIKQATEGYPYGCFAIVASDTGTVVKLNHLQVSGGSFSTFHGLSFTGQFAIFGADVIIRNSIFTESNGDDGLNVKYGRVELDSTKFLNNRADQVDLDFCIAKVSNCEFAPSSIDKNGDGLDLSGSYGYVLNCKYSGFEDKALSLGEKSKVLVQNCLLDSNYNAIAAKDETNAMLHKNIFSNNHRDVIAYVKKPIFGIPSVVITSNPDSIRKAMVSGSTRQIDSNQFRASVLLFQNEYVNFSPSLRLDSKIELAKLIERDE